MKKEDIITIFVPNTEGQDKKKKKPEIFQKRSNKWFVTVNNPECLDRLPGWHELCKEGENPIQDDEIRYIKIAYEIGKNGNRHLHAYIHLFKRQRGSYIAKMFRWEKTGVHVEIPRKPEAAIDYPGKEDKDGEVEGCYEWGDREKLFTVGGDRYSARDLIFEDIKEDIDKGMCLQKLWKKYFVYMVRHYRGIERYYELVGRDKAIKELDRNDKRLYV